jgi:nucleotide-binding universal stress UspA family protein
VRGLIAYDGSPGAEQAVALAAALRWPPKSQLRVAIAVEPPLMSAPLPGGGIIPMRAGSARQRLAEPSHRLAIGGRRTRAVVLDGRPGTVLVEEAARSHAELIIAGSRGYGGIASLLLGSVSAELVDNSPCPVLVARTPPITGIVLAVDGSPPADRAESVLSTWQIFEGLPIHVVSVIVGMEPVQFGAARPAYHRAAAEHAKAYAAEQEFHTKVAEESAARLRAAGRQADPITRSSTKGAAEEIIALASETGSELVVMGSRGRTGLARIVLGSVARNILYGSPTSVLIVRAETEDRPVGE